jgi:uncharacterized protein YdaU (DUF1376 family)
MPLDLSFRDDQKIVAMEAENPALVLLFIYLVQMMFQEKGPLAANYKILAYTLRFPTQEDVRHVVEDFELFVIQDGMFWNASALERIERKEEYVQDKREAGKASGAARRARTAQGTNNEQPLNRCSTGVRTEPEQPAELSNQIKSNEMKSNKSLRESAGAGAPAREDDDFIFLNFFFRNFKKPGYETDRCLRNYSGQDVKSWDAVIKRWTPEDASPRFQDPRALQWARQLYDTIADAADPAEATECLRHVDAIDIDKARNELKARMRGESFRQAVYDTVADNPSLRDGYAAISICKRSGT